MYGPQCKNNVHYWLFGGPGWPFNNQTISIYIYNMEAICSGFFLSCRINDEVSADAAADAAYVTTTKLLYPPSTLYIHTGDTIRLSCIRFEHCL